MEVSLAYYINLAMSLAKNLQDIMQKEKTNV